MQNTDEMDHECDLIEDPTLYITSWLVVSSICNHHFTRIFVFLSTLLHKLAIARISAEALQAQLAIVVNFLVFIWLLHFVQLLLWLLWFSGIGYSGWSSCIMSLDVALFRLVILVG